MISLPECFNSPYGTKYFPEYAESVPDGVTSTALKEAAQKQKVTLNRSINLSCASTHFRFAEKACVFMRIKRRSICVLSVGLSNWRFIS